MQNAIETDALVIGAGPCGLFQAFELGLLGISCHIVEALDHPGGQCAELYADKPIYDIPGIPHTSASALVDLLLRQIEPFDTTIHYGQTAVAVETQSDGRIHLTTDTDASYITRNLIVAAGVGAFSPVRLKVEGLSAYDGRQIHYREMPQYREKRVVVCGDTELAVATALQLSLIHI